MVRGLLWKKVNKFMEPLNKLKEAEANIKRHYLSPDERPWIVGFSGGKDSTTLLQMVFHVLADIPPKKRKRMVYVLSSDTLLEPPNISRYLYKTLLQIDKSAHSLNLPMQIEVVKPNPNDTFFIRLIGFGYPSPNRWFRWCTDRLKIRPANRFIQDKLSLHGGVILLLGSRKAESSQRAASIKKHYNDAAEEFAKHTSLTNAYVFSPIKDLSTDEIWSYLLLTPCPWSGDNLELLGMYKDANSGECPLVVDDATPPCGNSRFGCWVCTVVERDRSMEGFIEAGYENYEYLLEFRNWLYELRDNEDMREKKRRNGADGLGPFRLEVRREILDRLLKVEKLVGEELISKREVEEIKRIWIADSLSVLRRTSVAL
jgi:DNA sulfur modification protein DndC